MFVPKMFPQIDFYKTYHEVNCKVKTNKAKKLEVTVQDKARSRSWVHVQGMYS